MNASLDNRTAAEVRRDDRLDAMADCWEAPKSADERIEAAETAIKRSPTFIGMCHANISDERAGELISAQLADDARWIKDTLALTVMDQWEAIEDKVYAQTTDQYEAADLLEAEAKSWTALDKEKAAKAEAAANAAAWEAAA